MHPLVFSFAQAALQPQDFINRRGDFQPQVDRRKGLIRDQDAQAEEFDGLFSRFADDERDEAVQTLVDPFEMAFSQNFWKKELQPGKNILEMLMTGETGSVWNTAKDYPQ